MQNILFFLYRYGYVVLFLILQVLSINLVIRHDPYHNELFIKSSSSVTGWILQRYDSFAQFLNLSTEARRLAEENANMMSQTANYKEIYGAASSYLDSNATQKYELVTARVINNSISNLDNYFTLDVGANDGILPDMGVIQSEGVLGVISDVSSRYATGISLLHRDAKISVAIQRNHFFGTLSWNGGDPRKATLNDIPKHADLVEGDPLVTSGFSAKFPQGIVVGKIASFHLQEGGNFYSIEVDLANDISRAHYVYVVKNLTAVERLNLEEQRHGKSNN